MTLRRRPKPRNAVAALLILISYGLLYPGLTLDLITIRAKLNFLGRETELYNETRSIIGSIRSLHDSGNDFVAGLILLFSVIVPLVKGILLLVALAWRNPVLRHRLYLFVRSISKWSMADVFVVGVYISFLAAKATQALDAVIRPGFYWFTAYCLVSLLALQFLKIEPPPDAVPGRVAAPAAESLA